jgi:hypothetical protein
VGPPVTVPPHQHDKTDSSLFAPGVWMSRKLLPSLDTNHNNNASAYIWVDPLTALTLDKDNSTAEYLHLKDVGTVARHGTFRSSQEIYRFDELGSYCMKSFVFGAVLPCPGSGNCFYTPRIKCHGDNVRSSFIITT